MLRHQQDDVECDASIFKARKKQSSKAGGCHRVQGLWQLTGRQRRIEAMQTEGF